MPEPTTTGPEQTGAATPAAAPTDDTDIRADESLDDAEDVEDAATARDEAERLGSAPPGRVENDPRP